MNNNIQLEAAVNTKKITNLYNTKNKYVDGKVTVESPYYSEILLYKDFLLANSEYKKLEPKYKYRPNYVAYAEYGDTNLDFIILLLNNCRSVLEFNKSFIYVPDINSIIEVLTKLNIKSTKTDLTEFQR